VRVFFGGGGQREKGGRLLSWRVMHFKLCMCLEAHGLLVVRLAVKSHVLCMGAIMARRVIHVTLTPTPTTMCSASCVYVEVGGAGGLLRGESCVCRSLGL
jgi:hypothetical protein